MLDLQDYEGRETLYESPQTIVLRGVRKADNLPVVLKSLRQEYPSPREASRLQREFEITRHLEIQGVVKSMDLVPHKNSFILIQEDFGGESLQSLLKRVKLSLDGFLSVGVQLADTLGQLHRKSIIHKDVNPTNILINPHTMQTKLTDFGIASLLPKENNVRSNLLEGTLAYISPEQTGRMNRSTDYRTDLYSLGVTLYEMLTTTLPFAVKDPVKLVHCHIARKPIPPIAIDTMTPRAISDIIMKLLAKTAEERYQSAFGLKADLERCLRQWQEFGDIERFELAQSDFSGHLQIPEKLYGRDAEIKTLLDVFDSVMLGRREVLLVTGDPGIGKSSLVREVQKRLARERGYFVSGKFDQYQRNIPYTSLIQSFQDLVRQILTEGAAQLQYWRDRLQTALGPNGRVLAEVIPEIELILGEQPPVPQLSPAEAQNRFRIVFQNFTTAIPAKEHPLIIFLDDLQWADGASLDLLQYLITSSAAPYFLGIGAYRDTEVNAAHPLTVTIDGIEKAGVTLHRLSIQPLKLEDVCELIADSLRCAEETARPLAELILEKTGGNPFFVSQFLRSLSEENLLIVDTSGRTWRWDLEQIKRRDITDNVVALMTSKLRKLRPETQEVLTLAACIGNPFDLAILATVRTKPLRDTAVDLSEAVSDGLVWPISEDLGPVDSAHQEADASSLLYRFAHDRIQQAAYSIITAEERQIVHRRVGELLLRNAPPGKRDQKIFDIVTHLNLGAPGTAEEPARIELAGLNLEAGRKAKSSAAYQPAYNYFRAGLDQLLETDWETHYKTAMALHGEAAEAAYLSGDFEQMEKLADAVLNHARTIEDRVHIYEVKLHAYIAQARYEEVIRAGLPVLKMLGAPIPSRPNLFHILVDVVRTRMKLSGKRLEVVNSLPPMTDPLKLAAMRIMFLLGTAAYFVRPNMAALTALRPLLLSLKHGVSPVTASSYVDYGIILCGKLGAIKEGYRAGALGLQLVDALQAKEFETRATLLFNALIRHWRDHARDALSTFWSTYQKGLESGDFQFASMAVYQHLVFSYHCGVSLDQIEQERTKCLQALTPLNQKSAERTVKAMLQTILNFMGRSADPRLLQGEEFDEAAMMPVLVEENDTIALYDVHIHKAVLEYHFGDYSEALRHIKLCKKYLDTLGAFDSGINNMYESLAMLGLGSSGTRREQRRRLRQVKANQRKLKKWADNAPMNHLQKYELVEAERARVRGDVVRAMDLYDRAIASARSNQYVQEEALANEVAAKFYLARSQTRNAKAYLQEARYLYNRWGAGAKVRQLEAKYGALLEASIPGARTAGDNLRTNITSSTEGALDFLSVLKASQAISGEIDLERLLTRMIKIVIENAGGERGCLILESDGRLVIEAEGSFETDDVTVLRSLPVESSPARVPAAIVNYVWRTRDNVVLNDATREGRFGTDAYILEHLPKSVLCRPIVKQGVLIGILYLENALTANAFTPDRLEVLDILSAQIAVALENARLYHEMKRLNADLEQAARKLEDYSRTLEDKVAQRTQELSARNEELAKTLRRLNDTQTQLITQEKLASLGQLTAGIAHEIKNPLNFVNNFAELSLELIDEMREGFEKLQERIDAPDRAAFEELLSGLEQNSRKINEHGKRADSIVRSMLQHSRGKSGERLEVDINAMLDETLGLAYHGMRAQDPEFNVAIEKSYDQSVGYITLVPQDVSRVFLNIIANSFYEVRKKRAEAGNNFSPALSVRTRNLGASVEVRIRDNGNGIPEQIRDKVFSPFFTTKAAGEGTGLGLSLSYDIIVKGHGGDLTFETEGREYTELIIRLPRAFDSQAQP